MLQMESENKDYTSRRLLPVYQEVQRVKVHKYFQNRCYWFELRAGSDANFNNH